MSRRHDVCGYYLCIKTNDLLLSVRRVLDDRGNFPGMREHDGMACRKNGCGGVHHLRHVLLVIRIDHVIISGHDVPVRLGVPRCDLLAWR